MTVSNDFNSPKKCGVSEGTKDGKWERLTGGLDTATPLPIKSNHFNLSVSGGGVVFVLATVKWRIRVKKQKPMSNGGYHRSRWGADAIIIRKADVERVHDYARNHASPRDYLILRVMMKIGLRTGEVCTLRIEHIDFDDRAFLVLDSKTHELSPYPLPMDILTLQLMQDLIGEALEGLLFTRSRSWRHVKEGEPLSIGEVWHIIHKIGLKASVKGFKPRILREYFAFVWAHVEKKSLVTLQRILRHQSLETTSLYVQKLHSWEDMQREYNGVKNQPFVGSDPLRVSICNDCPNLGFCKFAPLPSCVEGCRFKVAKKEVETV